MIAVARHSYAPLGFSYALALITGFFQATFWGLTGIGEIHGIAGPVAAVTFAAWLGSVGWTFSSSRKLGWFSLIGMVPALSFIWCVAYILSACAAAHVCI